MDKFDPFESVICTEEQLNDLCRFWLKQLGINHWNIALRISRAKDFEVPGNQGEIDWVLDHAYARISILDPIDYPEGPFKYDMEVCLVHELLHIHAVPFDNFESDCLEEKALERMIEMTARALVDLRRRGQIKIGQEPKKED